jgi:hypothetical protein
MNVKNQGVRRPAGSRGRTSPSTGDGMSRTERELAYLTSGSSALAPAYVPEDDVEPALSRSAEERDAADQRAAERAANRAAGRAEMESRRRLRVAPPMPVSIARAPFVATLIGIVVAGVVGILVLTAMINANQFRLNNLQSQQAGLDEQEQTARQTLTQQQSPGSLVTAAKNLGLVPAGTLAYIQLPDGRVVGAPQPASKTPSVTAQSGTPSGATTTRATPTGAATTPTTTSTGH